MVSGFSDIPVVILAAGEGSRIREAGPSIPKPLIPVLGLSLLERTVLTCREAGFRRFLIVVGYEKEKVLEHIDELRSRHKLDITAVENRDWRQGNGTSVLSCQPHLRDGPFFVAMCDHLFEPQILHRLLDHQSDDGAIRLAVDRAMDEVFHPEDATKVHLDGNLISAIGKELSSPSAVDTGFFLCFPMIFTGIQRALKKGDGSLTAGVRELIPSGQLVAVDVTGLFWHDVDTAEALRSGEERLIRRIFTAKKIDGPVSRYLNRHISTRITKRIAHYPITPNQVTVVSTGVGLLGAALFFCSGFIASWHMLWMWVATALAGILIQISSILDGVDGEIARLKHLSSPYGAYMDYMLDRYVDGTTVSAMIFAVYVTTGKLFIIFVGCLALIGLPLSSIHRAKFLAETRRNYLPQDDGLLKYIPYSRDVRLFVIFLGGVLNILEFALYFLAMIPNVIALIRLYTVKRAMERFEGR
jgi:CDP-L-myo-inositol myo-inositolphosphotransferase